MQEWCIATANRMHDYATNTVHSYAQCCLRGYQHGVLYQQSARCLVQWREGKHANLLGHPEWRHILVHGGPDGRDAYGRNLERVMHAERHKQGHIDRADSGDNGLDVHGYRTVTTRD